MVDRLKGRRFVICINNEGYPASLELWKVYQVIPDAKYESHQELRVIDEEGEDYLYPAHYFSPVQLEKAVAEKIISQSL